VTAARRDRNSATAGVEGWDAYAPFYDWENARTVGRRDVPFWRSLAAAENGPVLELGCGTGRITIPAARAGAHVVGVDRSAAMLERARSRVKRLKGAGSAALVRGDIRELPFRESNGPALSEPGESKGPALSEQRESNGFSLVMAPYGILQSLTREKDLTETLASVHRVLRRGGTFGIDLVPDLPRWSEYSRRVSLRGLRGKTRVTLVESVRQDRKRRLTIFDHEYVERRGRLSRVHTFSLTFRTLSVPQITRRLAAAGFHVTAVLGDYKGGPWSPDSDVWVILAARG
jgi:SAM-dependent methyltransferase